MSTSHNRSMPEQQWHTACIEHDGKHCDLCETRWPCPAYTAALDAVRATAADRDRTDRDHAIRHALAIGVPVAAVSRAARVTPTRIRQIEKSAQ